MYGPKEKWARLAEEVVADPEADPEEDSVWDPGEDQEVAPGVDPEEAPGVDLEEAPGVDMDQVADPFPLVVEEGDPDTRVMSQATLDQEHLMTVLNFLVLWQYFVF